MTKFCGTVTAVTAALLMLIPVSAGQATSAQPGPLATPSLSLGLPWRREPALQPRSVLAAWGSAPKKVQGARPS